VGQYTPAVDSPGSDRIRRIIALPNRRIYGVFDFEYTQTDAPGAQSVKTYFSDHLRLWGLDFTDESCEAVSLRQGTERRAWLKRVAGLTIHAIPPSFFVCELRASAAEEHERVVAEFTSLARKLERFGAACPQYFGKPLTYIRVYQRWMVSRLVSFDWRLDVHDDGAIYLHRFNPSSAVLQLGRMTADGILANEADCRKWFPR
jgi:hypothetical protein